MEKERSIVVTGLLCVALVGGNYWVMTLRGVGFLGYFALWPVAFILCVVIAARIWHGHSSL